MRLQRALVPLLLAGALVMSAALGVRQTFGLFLGPLAAGGIVTVGFVSLALAIQNLIWGLAQPFAGGLTDRFGPAPVVAAGAVIYAAGLIAVAWRPDALAVIVGFGILVGLGQAAMTFAVVISSISRAADPRVRATAVALVAAGGSLGQVALIPLAQAAVASSGVRGALLAMAGVALGTAPLGLVLQHRRDDAVVNAGAATATAVRTALRDPNFLLLTAGFFACGYQLAFMTVHLPGYLVTCHVGTNVGAAALATIGFFNVIGTFAFGRAAARIAPHRLLAGLYTARATATVAYLLVPVNATTTLAFAVVMGLTWLGTVPLTNAVVARLHGLPNLGALFGVCFVGHQLGGFLGALAGGLAVQWTGSYETVWISTVVVGYAAALANVPIRYCPAILAGA